MLAKAVASESGAHFINVNMSAITSKWFGEGERLVRCAALLHLSAACPCAALHGLSGCCAGPVHFEPLQSARCCQSACILGGLHRQEGLGHAAQPEMRPCV